MRFAHPSFLRAVALAAALLGAWACDPDPGGGPPDTAETADTDVGGLPDYAVAIDASELSGNAPLNVDFAVTVTGEVDPTALRYRWTVDGAEVSEDPTFSFPFYRAGSATIGLQTEWRSPDGRSVTARDTVVIRIQGCAELRFDRLTLNPPVEVAPGDTLLIGVARLLNDGDLIEGDFDVQLVLSLDDRYDADADIVAGTWTVDGMPSGLREEVAIDYAGRQVPVPPDVTDGDYFVFLVADPDNRVNECQEANNTTVSTNTLQVAASAAFKPDLAISGITVPGASISQGETLNYSFTLANLGAGDASAFRLGFWLSTDVSLDPERDVLVADPDDDNSKISTLPAGASLPFFKSYRLPPELPDGSYYLIGELDTRGEVVEEDETNNVTVSVRALDVKLEVPACADLTVESFEIAPLATYWNGSVQLRLVLRNIGTEPSAAGIAVKGLLSQQQSLNPSSARVVGEWTLPALGPGETFSIEELIGIEDDLPVLPHFVGVIVDPEGAFAECVETNNAAQYPEPLQINATASVDLGLSAIDYHPTSAVAGTAIKLEFDVTNAGTSGATAFEIGIVLSEDAQVTRQSIASGEDVVIARRTVSTVPANGAVTRIEDVIIPLGLDHAVTTYTVAVVADLGELIGQDAAQSNNIRLASVSLTVTQAAGGCYEDAREDDDTQADARSVVPGVTDTLGSCGDEDWFTVDVPATHSLRVDALVAPILSVAPVASEVIVELRDPLSQVVDRATVAGGPADADGAQTYGVRAWAVPFAGRYTLSLRGASADVRAHYALDVSVAPPPQGTDLVTDRPLITPGASYPGGALNVSWRVVNVGQTGSGAYRTRVWASEDAALQLGQDVLLADIPQPGVPALTEVASGVDVTVPTTLSGGDWYVLITVDADDDVAEAEEADNDLVGGPIFVNVDQACVDDSFEPNDELRIATVLGGEGEAAGPHVSAIACTDAPDWYAVDLAVGEALEVTLSVTDEAPTGRAEVTVWDPTEAPLLTASVSAEETLTLPWTWLPGRYAVSVDYHDLSGGEAGSVGYDLGVSVAPGPPEAACAADAYEGNSGFSQARRAGCGVLNATLCRGDTDYYLLSAVEAQQIRMTMSHRRSETRMRLYTEAFGPAVKTRTGNGTLTHLPTADGELWLEVSPRLGPLAMNEYPYSLTITGIAGVDLSLGDHRLTVSEVVAGEDVGVALDVFNGCTEDAAAFEVAWFLSDDFFWDPTDLTLGVAALPDGLVAGDSAGLTDKVTIPLSTAPGAYFLLAVVDGGGAVAESNEDNNVLAAALTVAPRCEPDALEPNDGIPAAGVAGVPVVVPPGAADLTVCRYDEDWFAVSPPAGSRLHVAARFAHADGDLDMRLYDTTFSTITPVATATSSDDDEEIAWEVPLAATFLVRVAGFGGASAPYALEVTID